MKLSETESIFFADGANRGAVNLMKIAFDESLDWEIDDVSPEIMKIIRKIYN
jgi:hypothetical protein